MLIGEGKNGALAISDSMEPNENQVLTRFDASNVQKPSDGQSGAMGSGKTK